MSRSMFAFYNSSRGILAIVFATDMADAWEILAEDQSTDGDFDRSEWQVEDYGAPFGATYFHLEEILARGW